MSSAATKPSWRPYIVLAIGLLSVSSASIMIRMAQQAQASSLVIAAWRVGMATLVLTPLVLTRYRADLARLTRRDIGLGLLAGALLSVHFYTWITSLEYTSVISSVVLVNTHPLWVVLATPFILRERLSKQMMLVVLLAMIGGILVSVGGDAGTAPRQNAPLLGNGLAVIGAITVAGYFMIGRLVRAKMALIPYIWLVYGSAGIMLWIAVLATGQQVTGLPGDAYLWMTLMALFPQLIGHSSYNYALGYLSAAYVSLTILGEPIGSTILAAIFLSELPRQWQLVGSAIILCALLIASVEEARATRRASAQRQQAVAT